jgi:hypothetical protein
MQALVALRDVDLHLRKLNIAMLQKNVDPSPLYFRTRTRQVTAEHHTDIYLADPTTDTGKQSASWLRKVDGGCYCPMPYPSWQAEARDKAYADARRLVVRARRASHQVFNRLRWEARHVAGTAPLFNEFVRENFDDVMYLKGNNIDMPPGRGFIASGPRTDKLFFRRDHIQEDGLSRFQASSKAWFKDALSGFEGLSLIVTREWIGVFSRCPEMELFGEVYPYLIENGHFSSFYNHAYAFPLATVVKGIRRTMYDPAVGPTPETKDLAHEPSSIARMLLRTRGPSVAKPGLVLGTMSQLFGGMCNALPVGWAPTFAWEKGRSGDVWKDAYQHVHWSWLVWTDRDNREFVDRSVTPLRAAHEQIAAYTDFSQKLLASVFDRYAAWKSDLTPGEHTAPRLLTRAYEIYRGYQRNDPSLPKDEVAYIAAYSRNDPDARPIPLLNCANLQLLVDGKSIQLPTSSDGTENAESSLWRRHVLPYTLSQDREGLQGEGEYYLALVGEKDL